MNLYGPRGLSAFINASFGKQLLQGTFLPPVRTASLYSMRVCVCTDAPRPPKLLNVVELLGPRQTVRNLFSRGVLRRA